MRLKKGACTPTSHSARAHAYKHTHTQLATQEDEEECKKNGAKLEKDLDPETGTAIDNSDGSYGVSYKVTRAGTYRLGINIAGVYGAGSPHLLQIKTDKRDPSKTYVYGSLLDIRAGIASTLFVQTRDRYGNNIRADLGTYPLGEVNGGSENIVFELCKSVGTDDDAPCGGGEQYTSVGTQELSLSISLSLTQNCLSECACMQACRLTCTCTLFSRYHHHIRRGPRWQHGKFIWRSLLGPLQGDVHWNTHARTHTHTYTHKHTHTPGGVFPLRPRARDAASAARGESGRRRSACWHRRVMLLRHVRSTRPRPPLSFSAPAMYVCMPAACYTHEGCRQRGSLSGQSVPVPLSLSLSLSPTPYTQTCMCACMHARAHTHKHTNTHARRPDRPGTGRS